MELKVTNYDYVNTGGNCMVGVFSCYCEQENRMYYIMTNEEGLSLSTADWINAEDLDYDDKMTVEHFEWHEVKREHPLFDVYKHCFIEYAKSDYKRFKVTARIPVAFIDKTMCAALEADELRNLVERLVNDDYEQPSGYRGIETDGERLIIEEMELN